VTSRRVVGLGAAAVALVLLPSSAHAQDAPTPCRFICDLEWKVEPTFTVENLFGPPRIQSEDGTVARVRRETIFETVLALDMTTRVPRLGFVAEASFSPTHEDNSVELEFEADVDVLREEESGGWVSSHVDVVDQFSPAERPGARRAYTHKLDFEWDTAFHVFNRMPPGSWLRGLEFETSLDYLATGLPRKGDVVDGARYLDAASGWSLSFVIVVPVAP
jgi:hypothetical protein